MPTADTRVLVVEDDEAIRRLLGLYLMEAGHRVRLVADATHALDELAHQPFDLVVTDYSMPGLSGMDLVQRVADLHPGLPVILISGAPPESIDWAAQVVLRAVVTKPFARERLLGVVRDAIALRPFVP